MAYTGYDTRLEWHTAELAALVAAGVIRGPRGRRRPLALDLGCGHGSESLFLARLGWSVIGIDKDRVALRAARERAGRLRLRQIDFHDADARFYRHPEGAGQFELVVERLLYANYIPGSDVARELGAKRIAVERKKILWTAAYALRKGGICIMRLGQEKVVARKRFAFSQQDRALLDRFFAVGDEIGFMGLLSPEVSDGVLAVSAKPMSIVVLRRNAEPCPRWMRVPAR
jgi:SAM-dependent methyltransferase